LKVESGKLKVINEYDLAFINRNGAKERRQSRVARVEVTVIFGYRYSIFRALKTKTGKPMETKQRGGAARPDTAKSRFDGQKEN